MNLLKNSIKETNENITSLGNTPFCTTVLPTAPSTSRWNWKKAYKKIS